MKRIASLGILLAGLLAGCNKPSEEDCRKAIVNMQKLLDTETSRTDLPGEVRRCRGGSSKKAVECAAAATSVDALRACEFMKLPRTKDKDKAEGSAP